MECKGFYKSRPVSSLKNISIKRSQILNAERHEKRREFFWGSRVAFDESVSEKPKPVETNALNRRVYGMKQDLFLFPEKKKNPRAEMLLKWKAEKMKKLEEEKKKRKPVFKVGVVQRKVTGSPLIHQLNAHVKKSLRTENFRPKVNDTEPKKTGVLTRSKAKNLANIPKIEPVDKPVKSFNRCYKFEGGKRKQIDSHVFKVPEVVSKLPCSGLTFPCSPKITRSKRLLKFEREKEEKDKDVIEKQTKLEEEKLEKGGSRIEEEVIENNSELCNVTFEKEHSKEEFVPIHYSPFITVRSGKKSKSKSKKSLTIDVDEQIKKEENEFKCRIFSFRKYIECEANRLMLTCEKWKHINQEFQEVPMDVEGDIDSVIGKTNLLTSDKFMQFKGLIDKCENGDPFVKIDDLQGFQDWVSIEVERIDEEFCKLEKRKYNNWISEQQAVDLKGQKKVVKNVMKKVVGKSNIRAHILAARKLLKEGNNGETLQLPTVELVKATTPKKKESLLKEVLTSETKKKNRGSSRKSPVVRESRNSGLEIMIATQKNKFPTPVKLQKSPCLTDFEILIENANTPSKSILKKVPKTCSTPKGHVKFENDNENTVRRRRGLSEKYFQPLADEEMSPMRIILGDLGNLSVTGMNTRSKTRQLSSSSLMNQEVN